MKRIALIAVAVLITCALPCCHVQAQTSVGNHVVGVALTVVTSPIGFGAQYEYAISEEFGIGGSIRYFGKSEEKVEPLNKRTVNKYIVLPAAHAYYHFMPKDKIDPFAGIRLGYEIYNETVENSGVGQTKPSPSYESVLSFQIVGGCQYWITPKIGGFATFELKAAGEYFDNSTSIQLGFNFIL